jgi:hypothetical protein
MSQKIRKRWKTKFARFVRSYGVELLAAGLDVRPSAVYHWVRAATSPRPAHAAVIQRLASERGVRLTLDQIYQHSRELRAENEIKLAPEGGHDDFVHKKGAAPFHGALHMRATGRA